MLKKPITYPDLDGNLITEEFYFNLTKAELIKLEAATQGGLLKHMQSLSVERDGAKIIQIFDDILATAYGRRSEDGKYFVKKPEFFDEFKSSEAYSILFMELIEGGDNAAKFVHEIMPKELVADVEKRELQKKYLNRVQDVPMDDKPVRNLFEDQGSNEVEELQRRHSDSPPTETEFGIVDGQWTRRLEHQEVLRLSPEQYRSYTDWAFGHNQ